MLRNYKKCEYTFFSQNISANKGSISSNVLPQNANQVDLFEFLTNHIVAFLIRSAPIVYIVHQPTTVKYGQFPWNVTVIKYEKEQPYRHDFSQ